MTQAQETQPLNLPLPEPARAAATADGDHDAARPRRRRRRSIGAEIARWFVMLVVFLGLAIGLLSVSLVAAIYWQARADELRPVEAIVVLGAAQFDGRPSPVLRARLDEALRAYEAGVAPVIVVTGGRQAGDRFTEAQASRNYLVQHGVPESAILFENEGRTSEQSMEGVAETLQELGLDTVLLVSDGFHLLRLKIMARDLGLDASGLAATDSPIASGSGTELSYILREAAGIVAYLWDTR